MGRAQLRWLRNASLPCPEDINIKENTLVLCDEHARKLEEGAFALCPPLSDLEELETWEVKDYNERLNANTPRDRSLPPAEALSGCIALLWLTYPSATATSFGGGKLTCNAVGDSLSFCATPWQRGTRAQQVVISVIRGDARTVLPVGIGSPNYPANVEIVIKVDAQTPRGGRWCWMSPYVAMVKAMELLGGAYLPAELLREQADGSTLQAESKVEE